MRWGFIAKKTIVALGIGILISFVVISLSVLDLSYFRFHKSRIRQAVDQSNEKVDGIADDIVENCKSWNWSESYCHETKAKRFARFNITYENTSGIRSPDEVITTNKGRCVGKAVVFTELMEEMGYEVQYVYQKEHICTVYTIKSDRKFFNCFPDEKIKFVG